MLVVALTAVVLTPIHRLGEPWKSLYVSALALILPWAALWRYRVTTTPGPFRDWVVTPLLYGAPLALMIGLDRYGGTLGLDPRINGFALLPALLSWFAVVSVGPWLVLFAAWPVIGRTRTRQTLVEIVVAGGMLAEAWLTKEAVPLLFFFFVAGFFVALVSYFHTAQPPRAPLDPPSVPGNEDIRFM